MKRIILLLLTLIISNAERSAWADESWQLVEAEGLNHTKRNQQESAQAAYERALALAQAHNAPAPDCVRLVCELSDAYLNQRKAKNAEVLLRQTLSQYDSAPSNHTLEYAEALQKMTRTLQRQDRSPETLEYDAKAAELYKELCKPDDPRIQTALVQLSAAQRAANEPRAARKTLLKTMSTLKKQHTHEARFTLIRAYNQLADLDADRKNISQAYEDCKQAIYIAEALYPPRHGNTGIAFTTSIKTLERVGAKEQARHLQWRLDQIEHSSHIDGDGIDPEGRDVGCWSLATDRDDTNTKD